MPMAMIRYIRSSVVANLLYFVQNEISGLGFDMF